MNFTLFSLFLLGVRVRAQEHLLFSSPSDRSIITVKSLHFSFYFTVINDHLEVKRRDVPGLEAVLRPYKLLAALTSLSSPPTHHLK